MHGDNTNDDFPRLRQNTIPEKGFASGHDHRERFKKQDDGFVGGHDKAEVDDSPDNMFFQKHFVYLEEEIKRANSIYAELGNIHAKLFGAQPVPRHDEQKQKDPISIIEGYRIQQEALRISHLNVQAVINKIASAF